MAALEVGDDPLECRLVRVPIARVLIGNGESILTLRVEEVLLRGGGELTDRCLRIPLLRLHRRGHHLQVPAPLWRARPRNESPFKDRLLRIDHAFRIYLKTEAESGALGACAVRRIEAEGARLEVVHHRSVIWAAELLAEKSLLERWLRALRSGRGDDDEPFAELQRRLDRVGEPAAIFWRKWLPLLINGSPHNKAIDHHLNAVSLLLVEFRRVVEVVQRSVDTDTAEARLPRGVEEGLPFTLPVAKHWTEHEKACPVRELQDLINNVIKGDSADGAITLRTVRRPSTRVEKSEVIPNLGDRPYG